MASAPPQRPQSQHRPSPTPQPEQPHEAPASPGLARSATSEDSQTLFLNSPPEPHPAPPPTNLVDDPAVKKCWICFSDSTEDTPTTSPWRDPCPCALVAHEECLLDWIADLEAPSKSHRSRTISAPKIECPQCKSEIKIARPRNVVVDAVRVVERLGARSVTPGALTFLSASLYHSSMAWGVHSIYAVFGSEDGYRILRPLLEGAVRPPLEVYLNTPRDAGRELIRLVLDHLVHWRLYVGLPLITPVLIMSRVRLADSILPVLPVLFFATVPHAPEEALDFTQWPPSASLCFALLPYARAAYNWYWDRVWAEKEKEWLKAIQPRQGQSDAEELGADAVIEDNAPMDEEDPVFEVRIDGDIFQQWEPGPEPPAPQQQPPLQREQAPPLNQPPVLNEDGDARPPPPQPEIIDARPHPQPPQDQRPNANPAPQPNGLPQQQQPAERRLSFSPTAIAEKVLGALLFPTIAGLSGTVLQMVLPWSWTMSTTAGKKGLLQYRWGRSLVGGCLFVVAKDAVMLYVRWKMAEMQRKRRVVDYDRSRAR